MKPTSQQVNIARELLDMLYKPAELARELFVEKPAVYEWTRNGMPHKKDDKGRLWVHGIKAGEWVLFQSTKRQKEKIAIPQGMIFCMKCQKPTKYKNAKHEYLTSGRIMVKAICTICGMQVRQFRKSEK